MQITGLTQRCVTTAAEVHTTGRLSPPSLTQMWSQVVQALMQGSYRRTVEATCANAVSSRSHAIMQLTVSQKMTTATMSRVRVPPPPDFATTVFQKSPVKKITVMFVQYWIAA